MYEGKKVRAVSLTICSYILADIMHYIYQRKLQISKLHLEAV